MLLDEEGIGGRDWEGPQWSGGSGRDVAKLAWALGVDPPSEDWEGPKGRWERGRRGTARGWAGSKGVRGGERLSFFSRRAGVGNGRLPMVGLFNAGAVKARR